MKALVLRFDAPMLSFGTTMVDQYGYIDRFPGTSMLCGLIANALGWEHRDFDRLQALQGRIHYAARWDSKPESMIDYHTVDLGLPGMRESGWTTRGVPEHRSGGTAAKYGTHQRYRHYWTDGLMTLVLGLSGSEEPSLETVMSALQWPSRPLFLGRKTCMPSRPLVDPESPIVEGEDLLRILNRLPILSRFQGTTLATGSHEACWPAELGPGRRGEIRRVYDLRDWSNNIPSGSRLRAEGLVGEGCL